MAQKKSGFWKDFRVFIIVFSVLAVVVILGRDILWPQYTNYSHKKCTRCFYEEFSCTRVILWIPLIRQTTVDNSGTQGCVHTLEIIPDIRHQIL